MVLRTLRANSTAYAAVVISRRIRSTVDSLNRRGGRCSLFQILWDFHWPQKSKTPSQKAGGKTSPKTGVWPLDFETFFVHGVMGKRRWPQDETQIFWTSQAFRLGEKFGIKMKMKRQMKDTNFILHILLSFSFGVKSMQEDNSKPVSKWSSFYEGVAIY